MKVIIAGSREFRDFALVRAEMPHTFENISEVVCGCADGADKLGFRWARESNIPVSFFPGWEHQHTWAKSVARPGETITFDSARARSLGKSAGFARNRAMAAYADGLVAFWDGKSRGTANMYQVFGKSKVLINYSIVPR